MKVSLAYNVKPGLRLAQVLQAQGLLHQYFGVGMLPRELRRLPMPGKMRSRFNAARVEPDLGTLPYRGVWEAEVAFHGLSRWMSLDRRLQLSQAVFDAHVTTQLEPCDVYHATSGTMLWSGRKARKDGARLVCHRRALHHQEEADLAEKLPGYTHPEARLAERLEREYALADAILCNSELTAASFLRRGHDKTRVHVIHNAVDTTFFSPDRRIPYEIEGGLRLLYVGTVDMRKGVDLLASALKANAGVKLTVAGRVDDRRLASQLLHHGAEILGSVGPAHLRQLYRSVDALVLPSRADAFGYVVSESLACGTPAIVSDACGAAEVVSRFNAGLVFPAGDAVALSEAIEALRDPGHRRAFVRCALESRTYLGWGRYGSELLDLYNGLAARGRP